MELDTRRLYLAAGYSSLFTYCTRALHLSEHAAYNRIETARVARRFPIVLNLIEEGAVTLTSIRLLGPHLTRENHTKVLEQARHCSKRDIELLVAGLHPQPDVPSVVRKLPTAVVPAIPPTSGTEAKTEAPLIAARVDTAVAVAPVWAQRPPRPAEMTPLAPERYKIQFTVGRETYDKLRRAQDLLRHSVPTGDPAVIVGRALTLLVEELERQKAAATDRPRAARRQNAGSRHIPADLKRAVWERDGGRCAFVGVEGRCAETGFLEYHHVVPFAVGGETSVGNVELRCRSHNAYEAERYFGSRKIPTLREERSP